jgi:hypothetical protein
MYLLLNYNNGHHHKVRRHLRLHLLDYQLHLERISGEAIFLAFDSPRRRPQADFQRRGHSHTVKKNH